MDDYSFANDALNRARAMTKSASDAAGREMADNMFASFYESGMFDDTIKSMKDVPQYIIYDIFDAMGHRLAERFITEIMYAELDKSNQDNN